MIRPIFRIDGQLVCTIGVTVHVRISRAVGAPSTMEAFYPFDAEAERYLANAFAGVQHVDRATLGTGQVPGRRRDTASVELVTRSNAAARRGTVASAPGAATI